MNNSTLILHVDDDVECLTICCLFGSDLNVPYETFEDPQDLLARIKILATTPESNVLVITDHVMPFMNGDEVIARARELIAPRRIRFIVVSSDDDNVWMQIDSNIPFVRKPVFISDFLKACYKQLAELAK